MSTSVFSGNLVDSTQYDITITRGQAFTFSGIWGNRITRDEFIDLLISNLQRDLANCERDNAPNPQLIQNCKNRALEQSLYQRMGGGNLRILDPTNDRGIIARLDALLLAYGTRFFTTASTKAPEILYWNNPRWDGTENEKNMKDFYLKSVATNDADRARVFDLYDTVSALFPSAFVLGFTYTTVNGQRRWTIDLTTPTQNTQNLEGFCAKFIIDFVSAFGPSTPDPNKMYYIGKPSTIVYETPTSANPITTTSLNSLYTFSLNGREGTFSMTWKPWGTLPFAVGRNKTEHWLQSVMPGIGQREDAYGLPFITAKYELWLHRPASVELGEEITIRPVYGNINIQPSLLKDDMVWVCDNE
jgi:hypothetical protein